jgi:hypothetical protein
VERLALLVLGLWLGLLVASSAVATVNFRTVDRLLGPGQRPELARTLEPVPPEGRRFALRHLVSEVNRWIFRTGGIAQLALAAAVTVLLWPAGGTPRWLALAALAITAVQAVGLAGAIASFGRPLDFVPRPSLRFAARGLRHRRHGESAAARRALGPAAAPAAGLSGVAPAPHPTPRPQGVDAENQDLTPAGASPAVACAAHAP